MVFDKVLLLFLLIVVGYLARKLNFVPKDIKSGISSLVLNVTLPLYILTAMQFEFSPKVLKESGILIIISFSIYAAVTLFSYLYTKVFKIKDMKRDVFQYVVIFSNVGYMGYPVMDAIAGEKGRFYAAIYNLSFNILTWTLGVYLMSRHKNEVEHQALKSRLIHVLNPSLFAVIIGFTFFIFSVKIPGVLNETFVSIGKTTTPISMMFIGFILAEIHIKDIFNDFSVILLSAIRLLVIPVIVFFILKSLGFSDLVLTIPVVLSAMPAAANTAIVANRYDNDYQLASKLIFVTTLLSIFTIPLILKLLT